MRPQSGQLSGQGASHPARPAPGSAQQHPKAPQTETNWKPMIWAIIFAVAVILIALLIANI